MSRSGTLFARAQQVIPGGVNSPVRAFRSVGGDPVFIRRAQGAYVHDEDNQRYVDYVGSWGPMILGHTHPRVVEAIQNTLADGLSYGAPTALEVELAEKICALMPTIEMVRMVNSGTEATLSAIRLARGVTKRNKILKFEGCYHGHSDSLLIKSGSGGLTFGIPDSLGVPADFAQHTLNATYNDLKQVEQIFAQVGHDIAAIIVEPVAANMNCVLPQPGFLTGLRAICDHYQSLLIFDEVITGFRVALGGAQAHYGISPDITTLGKIIGGGLPVGAYGGRKAMMEHVSPLGGVYQAGTLSGNPLAMAAGLATLNEISKPGFYPALEKTTQQLVQGLYECAQQAKVPLHIQQISSLFGLFFTEKTQITHCQAVKQCDIERFKRFFHAMLQAGIYLAPSAFEAGFVSAAHGDQEITLTLNAATHALATL